MPTPTPHSTDYAPWDDEAGCPAFGPVPEPICDYSKSHEAPAPKSKKVFVKNKDESKFDLAYTPSDVKKETEKALSFVAIVQDGQAIREVPFWFPKSQVKDGKLPGWLVKKKVQELRETGVGFAPISICGRTFVPEN